MTVSIYVDTHKQVGDKDHLKVFASQDAAETWFQENDPGRRRVRICLAIKPSRAFGRLSSASGPFASPTPHLPQGWRPQFDPWGRSPFCYRHWRRRPSKVMSLIRDRRSGTARSRKDRGWPCFDLDELALEEPELRLLDRVVQQTGCHPPAAPPRPSFHALRCCCHLCE